MPESYEGNYNFKKLPTNDYIPEKRKANKGRNLWEKMGIALLIIWACFTLIFGLMYFNEGFKSTINQSVICSEVPTCPSCNCPETICKEQTCECNYPELNLTCNYPPMQLNIT